MVIFMIAHDLQRGVGAIETVGRRELTVYL